MNEAIGILETTGFTPAMVALDAMEKGASVVVLQAELNDFLGVVIKIAGDLDSVSNALSIGQQWAERFSSNPVSTRLANPDPAAKGVFLSAPEYNGLIEQFVVKLPRAPQTSTASEDLPASEIENTSMSKQRAEMALGFIETQGFTAVFDAIDTACKAANVEVIGKEKLGGGYVTVVIRGDVAAVKAAIDAGQQNVASLGKLIAAHVIARPSEAVLSLLPG